MAKIPTKTKVAAKTAIPPVPPSAAAPAKAPAKRISRAAAIPAELPARPAGKTPASKSKPTIVPAPAAPAPMVKKAAPPRRKAAPAAPVISHENVAMRAYYIGEDRRAKGLPGDSHQDWIEAERQIQSELQPKPKTRKR